MICKNKCRGIDGRNMKSSPFICCERAGKTSRSIYNMNEEGRICTVDNQDRRGFVINLKPGAVAGGRLIKRYQWAMFALFV